jgi:hypothetical protein
MKKFHAVVLSVYMIFNKDVIYCKYLSSYNSYNTNPLALGRNMGTRLEE